MIAKNLNFFLYCFGMQFIFSPYTNNNVCSRTDQELRTLWPVLARITLRGVINVNNKISKISPIVFSFYKFLYIFERLTHSLKLFITKGICIVNKVKHIYKNQVLLEDEIASPRELVRVCDGLSPSVSEIWVHQYKFLNQLNNVVNFNSSKGGA